LIRLLLTIALFATLAAPVAVRAQERVQSPLDLADMDQSVAPGEDFFRFVNGGWLDRTPIPADWPSYGVFEELIERTDAQVIELLRGVVVEPGVANPTDQEKAAILFQQGMDLDTRNAQGTAPMMPFLARYDRATTIEEIHDLFLDPEMIGAEDFFNLAVTADPADSTMNILWMSGPFLGLPDVDYYTDTDPANDRVRDSYRQVLAGLLVAAGVPAAESVAAAAAVYEFESTLAGSMVTPEEAQDFGVLYNPTTAAELQLLYPRLDWTAYLAALGVEGSPTIINTEVELFQKFDKILAGTGIDAVRNYLKVRFMLGVYDLVGEDMQELVFPYLQALYGIEQQPPTSYEVLDTVNAALGDAAGQLYVAEHFSPESRDRITTLVEHLIDAFGARIDDLTWMTGETKALAREKLAAMRLQLGFPDTWVTYEDVEIGSSYFETAMNAYRTNYLRYMGMAGKPVDPDEWIVNAQEVNAFYNPQTNSIIFPAAFLQDPFFVPDADDAWNYGAIGSVIGHEITHGFDLDGSRFDAQGNYVNWWTNEDRTAFLALNDRVIERYSAIEILPGLFLNGRISVGENVADMGGLQAAYGALIANLDPADTGTLIDGFPPKERFFIAFATSWRGVEREETLRTQIHSGVHSPSAVRAVLPAQNMDAFYEVFDIRQGDPMWLPPEERIVVW
jgi:predicted metalloendopeptidase